MPKLFSRSRLLQSLLYGFLGLIFLSVLALIIWRYRAPSYEGQSLTVDISTPADGKFELLFLGDTGTGGEEQFKVASAMEAYCLKHSPSAVVLLGDNFYMSGVSSVDDPQWESKFKKPYGSPCLSQLPFYAVLGNHDYRLSPKAQIKYRGSQPSWFMPHRFYRLNFGQRLQIVAIDTNVLDLCGSGAHCTLDFLRQSLEDRQGRETIIVGHHPFESLSGKYKLPGLQSRILRRTLCGEDVTYIAGHSHHLEHRRSDACKLDIFISGGGGARLYPVRPLDTDGRFALSQHGFLRLKVSSEVSEFTFFDSEGQALYTTTRPST